MFEMMDQSQEACEQLEQQRNELEELWRAEKEKGRVAQRVRGHSTHTDVHTHMQTHTHTHTYRHTHDMHKLL